MRLEKRKRTDLSSLEREATRTEKDKPQDVTKDVFKNDINWELTRNNIFLRKPKDGKNWYQATKEILDRYGLKARKNATVMIDGLYTASPEFFANKSIDEIKTYFLNCLRFHEEHFGEVFSAVIHLDEKTPHMQVASVPVFENEKGAHLSARDLLGGRKDMSIKQDVFYEKVSKQFGLERGEKEKDPALRKKHIEANVYRAHQAEIELDRLTRRLDELQDNVKKLEQQKQVKSDELVSVSNDVFVRQYELDELTKRLSDKETLEEKYSKVARLISDLEELYRQASPRLQQEIRERAKELETSFGKDLRVDDVFPER